MRIKLMSKIISLGVVIILLGCNDKEESKVAKVEIAKNTKKALGDNTKESGCDSEEAKEREECGEEDSSSSSFILSRLEKNSVNDNQTNGDDENSLRGQLNSLLIDMSKEETTKENSAKIDLESLVNQVEEIAKKGSSGTTEELESLVESFDKEVNSNSVGDELTSLVDSVENSKHKREKVESELLALVGEVENKKLKREEVEQKLLSLVGDASEGKKQNLRQTQLSLESLVSSAEKDGTKEAKRLASSIIQDIAQNKIKILSADEDSVVIQVQSGDSLSALAQKYYGDATKYKIIYEANSEKIGNRNTIYPGTTLVIPKLQN